MTQAVKAELKTWAVRSVLWDHRAPSEVADHLGVSPQSVWNWQRAFLDAGEAALVPSGAGSHHLRDDGLRAENRRLRASLTNATAVLTVWREHSKLVLPSFDRLEAIRAEAALTGPRFASLLGISRRRYLEELRRRLQPETAVTRPLSGPPGAGTGH